MSQIKTETRAVRANTSPLFASVWLTLFNELRKNYLEQNNSHLDSSPSAYPETHE